MIKAKLVETLKKKFSVTMKRWDIYVSLFHFTIFLASFAKIPVFGYFVRRIGLLDHPEKNFTQGRVINLNKELNEKAAEMNTVLPIQLVKKAIQETEHLYIIHKCLCRDGNKCKDYPIDFGCLFMGEASKVTVERGIAKKVTADEAMAHVDRGAELGLVCQCLFLEVEKYFWGLEEEKIGQWLEICFCCPCCCLALNSYKKLPNIFEKRIHSIGFKASILDNCTQCGECVEHCPMHAIDISNGAIKISDSCLGCGICVTHCRQKAIEILLTTPIKENLTDYFWGYKPDLS